MFFKYVADIVKKKKEQIPDTSKFDNNQSLNEDEETLDELNKNEQSNDKENEEQDITSDGDDSKEDELDNSDNDDLDSTNEKNSDLENDTECESGSDDESQQNDDNVETDNLSENLESGNEQSESQDIQELSSSDALNEETLDKSNKNEQSNAKENIEQDITFDGDDSKEDNLDNSDNYDLDSTNEENTNLENDNERESGGDNESQLDDDNVETDNLSENLESDFDNEQSESQDVQESDLSDVLNQETLDESNKNEEVNAKENIEQDITFDGDNSKEDKLDNDDLDSSSNLSEDQSNDLESTNEENTNLENETYCESEREDESQLNDDVAIDDLSENEQKEENKEQNINNEFLNQLKDLPPFDERDRSSGYSIDTNGYTELPDSLIRTLITKFLNQRFCKRNTDLNVRSNSLEKSDGFYKWEVKDVIVHLETEQVTKVLTDKYGYDYSKGKSESIPLSFYFDLSGSMSEYTNLLSVIAIELLKKDVKVLIGFNEIINVQIDSINKNIDVSELAEFLNSSGYSWSRITTNIEDYQNNSKINFKFIEQDLDIYLKEKKAEKCVIFSDFDPRSEVIRLSKFSDVYWFCFERSFSDYDISRFNGFIYKVKNANDILKGLLKVNSKRFESLCYIDNPASVNKEKRRVRK